MSEKLDWALRVESFEPRKGYPARDKWGVGPWQDEPDLVEWRDAESGYPLLIVRGPSGALCGYVGLPPGHPLHGKGYSDDAADSLDVHGGLTFADACQEGGHICHAPREGEPSDVWWLGFDCNHSGDFDPGGAALLAGLGHGRSWGDGTYRALAYVRSEVESLAEQLRAKASSSS